MKRILFILLLFMSTATMAQNMRERGEVRRGNRDYLKEDYASAAEHYRQAVAESPENFEARYNLGSALIKGEQMEESEELLATLAADSLLADGDRSVAYYNLGNSQFQQQKLQEALESYKNAMRFDPDDMEAKYNYAYTKALLEQQDQDQDQDQNQDQQDQENQDQNDDQQDQQQNQDNQDQNEDQQDQNQDQQEQDGDQDEQEQPQQPEPRESEISEQEQQQMLDAIQAQEDKTQEDLKERARGVVVPGAKNW